MERESWPVFFAVALLILACAIVWDDFYALRVLNAFRDADPPMKIEAVWEALTCAPECTIDYPRN